MPNSERTAALRKRLYAERNGIVADTMCRLGVVYTENWGVSLATVRRIARETTAAYGYDHEWAKGLWLSPLRELRLASLWIGDATRDTDLWLQNMTTQELRDEYEFVLNVKRDR